MTETWLPAVGYEGYYSVSDEGHVRSEARTVIVNRASKTHVRTYAERILNVGKDQDGYPQVVLARNGTKVTRRVGHLVLESFRGIRPDGMLMRHLNNAPPGDARLASIEWNTQSRNIRDVVEAGNHRNTRKTKCVNNHEFTPENTHIRRKGQRECRTCCRDRDRKRRRTKSSQLNTATHRDIRLTKGSAA